MQQNKYRAVLFRITPTAVSLALFTPCPRLLHLHRLSFVGLLHPNKSPCSLELYTPTVAALTRTPRLGVSTSPQRKANVGRKRPAVRNVSTSAVEHTELLQAPRLNANPRVL